MIAECGILEMPQVWLELYGFKFAVLVHADVQFDTQFCETIEEAKACAQEQADYYSVETVRVY
jgi:hypothetical protein